MLDQLYIQNFVLIDHLKLDFAKGLTVLTGETGAGKSILLDAFGLILGDKAHTRYIRPGTTQATIIASFNFSPTSQIFNQLNVLNINPEDNIIIRRQISLDGKSKSFINDQPISLNLLKAIAVNLVDIHGQFDQILLPGTHIKILDQFCQNDELKQKVTNAYQVYQSLNNELSELTQKIDYKDSHLDYLKTVIDELNQFDLKKDEETNLLMQRTVALNNDKIVKGIELIYHHLTSENGIQSRIYETVQTAQRITNDDNFQNLLINFVELEQAVNEATSKVEEYKDQLTHRIVDIDKIDDRLHRLRFLARKHHCLTSQLTDKWINLQTEYNDLLKSGESKLLLEKKLKIARDEFIQLATTLSNLRHQTAEQFILKVEKELRPLKLDKVKIQVSILPLKEDQWHLDGIDQVEFMIQTNPGHPFNSITKIASGGERSRLMLAFKVVLASDQDTCLLIFDEIDSGVGGAVAAAIGERLGRLSDQRQVISVTHSPQVASYAQHHYLISKQVIHNQTQAKVKYLSPSERTEEIARMLSGEDVTDAARHAAQDLLHKKLIT